MVSSPTIESFEQGRLWIDIRNLTEGSDIAYDLGGILDGLSVKPFSNFFGMSWTEYIRESIRYEWKYIKVHISYADQIIEKATGLHNNECTMEGTATNEDPREHLVLTARDFVCSIIEPESNEDFDSLFD